MKDKENMATAVTATSPSNDGDGKRGVVPLPERGGLQAYKPGDGHATRLGIMAVVMAYVAFACYHWFYNWVFLRNFFHESIFSKIYLSFLTKWTLNSSVEAYIAYGGAAVIAAAGFATGYYFIYVKKASAEFLIKTDNELAKVQWPKMTPWFKAESPVWGATYVVLIVVVGMTLYVFGVDLILQAISQQIFYGGNR